jgi:hypothetical protein
MKNLMGRRLGRLRSWLSSNNCESFRHRQFLLDVKITMKPHFRFDFTFPHNYEVRSCIIIQSSLKKATAAGLMCG